MAQKSGNVRHCAECDRPFLPSSRNQIYCCPECREAHRERMSLLDWYTARPRRTEAEFLDDVAEAERQGFGTQYGHYMAHKAGII